MKIISIIIFGTNIDLSVLVLILFLLNCLGSQIPINISNGFDFFLSTTFENNSNSELPSSVTTIQSQDDDPCKSNQPGNKDIICLASSTTLHLNDIHDSPPGSNVRMSGELFYGNDIPFPGADINFEGSDFKVSPTRTDGQGIFSTYGILPNDDDPWKITAKFEGNANYGPSSDSISVGAIGGPTIPPDPRSTDLDLNDIPDSPPGSNVRVSGTLIDEGGVPLQYVGINFEGSDFKVSPTRTDGQGIFSTYGYLPNTDGPWTVKASFVGTSLFVGSSDESRIISKDCGIICIFLGYIPLIMILIVGIIIGTIIVKKYILTPPPIQPIPEIQIESGMDYQAQPLPPIRLSNLMETPSENIQIITVTGVERQ